ncbi:Uncharacterised protein [Serratia entomophila]|uniref:ExcB n=1 Tax=Serratia entomophila TaxID=42906 RepID=A7M7H9_9GAMM|nr:MULTISPECIES: hypothetical protein [Serratia]ABU23820.1 ExcB [Serratia entomophila]UIW20884.1 hypothetical protein KHA73_23930 [Serratia entomophila]ULG10277.1 ExcB [Serratia entomophila]ULG10556.1 ExcB [Serratia entomophila]ULG10775.1 ExcB [Serratia entomophila]
MTKTQLYLKSFYLMFSLCAGAFFILSSLVLFIVSDARSNPAWPIFSLAIGAILIYSFYRTLKKSKEKTENIINSYICNNFMPTNGYEIKILDIGKYVGIDIKNGTILLLSTTDSIFKGVSTSELTGYECRGNMLTLKFNNVYLPYFKIHTGSESKCMDFGHKLDVILSSSYRPENESGNNFGEFVRNKSLAYS